MIKLKYFSKSNKIRYEITSLSFLSSAVSRHGLAGQSSGPTILESPNYKDQHNLLLGKTETLHMTLMGHGGALVESIAFNRRVEGSTPALAAM